jgi:hypothetical protein
MKPLKYRGRDAVAYVVMILYLLALIAVGIFTEGSLLKILGLVA